MKKYIIFDLDGTLIVSMYDSVRIILEYLKNIPETDIEKAKYILDTTPGMALKNQLKLIFKGVENINYDLILNEIYKKLLSNDAEFYEGVIEKIIDLKDNYKLFLTTGNSTQVAKKYLEKGGIINYFELIYGSDEILKGEEHLEIFKEYTGDKDFYKKAIYVGDGDMDKEFAYSKNIDFIRVGYKGESDENRIKSVAEIDNILNNLS